MVEGSTKCSERGVGLRGFLVGAVVVYVELAYFARPCAEEECCACFLPRAEGSCALVCWCVTRRELNFGAVVPGRPA